MSIKKNFNILEILKKNTVPILFLALGIAGWAMSGQKGLLGHMMIVQELINRLSRNLILVLSLIIPITAGMGLNFAMVIGAMAGQFGLIFIKALNIGGVPGVLIAFIFSIPFALLFGFGTGGIMNRAKGREMITGLILGFFANGLYQLILLAGIGTVIPLKNPEIVLKAGVGLKNSMDFNLITYALDRLIPIKIMVGGGVLKYPLWIPLIPLGLVALICWFISFLQKTKLGQDFRAIGQDKHIAEVAGINVNKTRITAMILSTLLASLGQIIFIQNIGKLQTYFSHEQVGLFSAAALLIGGATVTRATISNAIIGTLLFHLLFIVSPLAGKNMFGDAQIGEYFRVFISYGVIAVAIVLYAMEKARAKSKIEAVDD